MNLTEENYKKCIILGYLIPYLQLISFHTLFTAILKPFHSSLIENSPKNGPYFCEVIMRYIESIKISIY